MVGRRLTMLTTYLTSEQAGASKAFAALVKRLKQEADLSVTLCCVRHQGEGVEAVQLRDPVPGRFSWRVPSSTLVSQWKTILAEAGLPPADVMYGNNMFQTLAYRALFPDVPIVTHTGAVIHSQEVRQEYQGSPFFRACEVMLSNRLEASMYRQPHWHHVVSTPLVAESRASHFRVPASRFEVIPYGIDPDAFPLRERSEARRAMGLPVELPVIISVARLVDWKRIELVLAAIAGLRRPVKYVVVGDGSARSSLEALARRLGLQDSVQFTGWTNPLPYLQTADIFVLPSLIESFGLVYAEAMMCALPCIGSRYHPPDVLSSARDIIEEGVTGFLIGNEAELTAKLQWLLDHESERKQMGDAARNVALRRFSTDAYVASLRKLMARIGDGGGQSR